MSSKTRPQQQPSTVHTQQISSVAAASKGSSYAPEQKTNSCRRTATPMNHELASRIAEPPSTCRDPARVGPFAPGARISNLPRASPSGTMWHHIPNAMPRCGVPRSKPPYERDGVGVVPPKTASGPGAPQAAAPFLDAAQMARWASGRGSCITGNARNKIKRPGTAPVGKRSGTASVLKTKKVETASQRQPLTLADDSRIAARRSWLVENFGEENTFRMLRVDDASDHEDDASENSTRTIGAPRHGIDECVEIVECCGDPYDGYCCKRHHPDDTVFCCRRHAKVSQIDL